MGLALSAGLTGCYKTVRIVQQTVAPEVYRSAPVEVLEKEISDRDAAIKTLNASVEISYSTGGGKEGKVTEYTSFRGYIFVRKPRDLRVLMLLPVLRPALVNIRNESAPVFRTLLSWKFTNVVFTTSSR